MKKRVVAIEGALCIAAGLITVVLLRGSKMDRLTGSWYQQTEDASQYLVLRNDLTYTLTRTFYSAEGTRTGVPQEGTFSLDGSTISIDVPEQGNVTVYKVSFSEDADAMTWTETPQHSWGYEFEYQRCE